MDDANVIQTQRPTSASSGPAHATAQDAPFKTLQEQIDDLNHDNNLMRIRYAELCQDYARLEQRIEGEAREIARKVNELVSKVDEFVSRFAVVN